MKKYLKIVLSLVFLFTIVFVLMGVNQKALLNQKTFVIQKQESFLGIADRLLKEGIIKDSNLFVLYAFFKAEYKSIKPGTYIFDGKISIKDVLYLLKNNKGISITIPEGYNIFQIEGLLLDNNIILEKGNLVNYKIKDLPNSFEKYEFLKLANGENNLEGFLYPNTYYFLENTNIEEVLQKFLDNFDEYIYQKVKNDITQDTFYEKLIKISLLEKEIYHKIDIPLAMSVLDNRLKADMRLQIDATLCYAKNMLQYKKGEELLCNKVLSSDKQIESEYNTYKNSGLVKTPIANVDFETFKFSLEQVESDYFYYITTPVQNNTIFAKTLDEHNRNIGKYLR